MNEIPTPQELQTASDTKTTRKVKDAVGRIVAELKRAYPEKQTVTVETMGYRYVVCEAVKASLAASGWCVTYSDKTLAVQTYSNDQRDNDDGLRTVFTVRPAQPIGGER